MTEPVPGSDSEQVRAAVLSAVDACAQSGLGGRRVAVIVRGSRFPVGSGDPEVPVGASGWTVAPLALDPLRALLVADRTPGGRAGADAVFPVRVLVGLGVGSLLLLDDGEPTRVAGEEVQPPACVVRDHVALRPDNPLAGPNDSRFGPRFPDMSEGYDPRLADRLLDAVGGIGSGVVGWIPDPTGALERGEADAWYDLGVSALTEGIAPYTIVARHAGLRVAAVVAHRPVDAGTTGRMVEALLAASDAS